MPEPQHATLHLKVLSETRRISVQVPPTPAAMSDLLPAARAVTDATIAVAEADSGSAGKPISCRRGCNACCHQLVAVTVPEARALKVLVDGMPPERQALIRERFAETARRARKFGVTDARSTDAYPVMLLDPTREGPARYHDLAQRYHAMDRPCGFLENGECSIYADRPLICREYAVTSPAEHCSHLSTESISRLEPPVMLSDGFAAVTAAVEQKPFEQLPLFSALAWADRPENQPAPPRHSGVDLLKALARWVDSNAGTPLEGRPTTTNGA